MGNSTELESGPLASRVREQLRHGAVRDAAALVDRALARSPDNIVAWYFRGVIANRCRDHDTAISALQKVIAIRPDAALAWLALGTALARSSRLEEAAHAYRYAAAQEPGWADAHLNLGLVQKRMGVRLAAIRSLHGAWKLDPMLFNAAAQCIATIAECVCT